MIVNPLAGERPNFKIYETTSERPGSVNTSRKSKNASSHSLRPVVSPLTTSFPDPWRTATI